MTNIVTGIIGITAVCLFLGTLLWWIKALPLILIGALVVLLLVIDFVQSVRAGNVNGTKG